MTDVTLTEIATTHRYRPSKATDDAYTHLRTLLPLEEKWQLARLAVSISLSDPSVPEDAPRDGQDIRAETLFAKDQSLPAFAALITAHAGRALSPEEIARQFEAHWHRGAQQLVERVRLAREASRTAESVILDLLTAANIEGTGSKSGDYSQDPRIVLDEVMVGQEPVKQQVIRYLREALDSDPRQLDAVFLFTGPASSGKTTLAKTIAKILDLPFVDANGDTLSSTDELLERLRKACADRQQDPEQIGTRGGIPVIKYPPAVVFIDECHQLPRRGMQTELLTALESNDREAKTKDEIADVSSVTFLLATTDSNGLIDPLRTRCRTVALEPYTRDEVGTIIQRRFAGWPRPVYQLLAVAGRLIPRQALSQAEDFQLFMKQDRPSDRASEGLVLEFMRASGKNELGLDARDYRYLGLLVDGSSRGLDFLASQLQQDPAEIESIVEPYLVQLGFVDRTPKGRQITSDGLRHWKDHGPEDDA